MVIERAEDLKTQLLVERARLEAEGVEPDADEALLPAEGLDRMHQAGAVTLAAQGRRHIKQLDENPVEGAVPDGAADRLARLWIDKMEDERVVAGRASGC